MAVRVYELAREFEMTSKDLLAYLKTQGLKARSHMSALDETVVQILRDRLPKQRADTQRAEEGNAAAAKSKSKSTTAAAKTGNGSVEARGTESRAEKRTRREPSRGSEGRDARGGRGDGRGDADKPRPTRKRYFPGAGDYGGFQGGGRQHGGRKRRPGGGGGGGAGGGGSTVKVTEADIQLPITIKELSSKIGLKVPEIMKTLMKKGCMLSMNAYLEESLIEEIGKEFEVNIRIKQEEKTEDAIVEIEGFTSEEGDLVSRAPVVTFLGHVDHGKTSLLDYIRKTKVTAKEHGGITQHLGAYRVDSEGIHVVFVDTPGHQAFTEMRSRGANITDVAVLVVAADEGVMPQTEEAYNHAKAAGVPVVVALNKMDKPGANRDRCYEQLSKLGLLPVAWGGDTEMLEVSAQTGDGIQELLETLSLESEILDLKADPSRSAVGTVLEAEKNPGRGNLVTILIQDGTLRTGDTVLCGHAHGRVRSMWLNGTTMVENAGPATPVQISGISELPEAGDRFYVFEDTQKARTIAESRSQHKRVEDRARSQKISLENIWERFQAETENELPLVIKADVKGTLQALEATLQKLSTDEVKIRVIHSGVGAIGQDDILLGDASGAIVLGFNVGTDDRARASAEEKQVEVRSYKVIYDAVDEIRKALEAKLAPILKEVNQGSVEIRQIYKASKIGNIAGCFVRKGSIFRDSKIRLVRDGIIVHEGKLDSLKRFKDDVKEAKEGFECGLKIAGYEDIKEGDIVEAYTIVREKRSL